jgi:hypothetical protein
MSDKFIRRSRKTAARMVGGEMVVLSVVDSSLYNLNAIASLVWQAADGATPLRAIVEERIVPQFEIDAETAYRDALELVVALGRHGILEVADAPLTEETP